MNLLVIILTALFFPFTVHVEHTAIYTYTQENDRLNLKFLIDFAELKSFPLDPDCKLEDMTAFCVAKYIRTNTNVLVNNQKVVFSLSSSKIEDEHLIIHLESDRQIGLIETISVNNHCFLEFEEKFKNRVVVFTPQIQDFYLLDKDRTEMKININ